MAILKRKVNRSVAGTIILGLILFIFGTFMALPMVYSIASSFKPLEELFIFPPRLFAQNPTIENYRLMGDLLSNLSITFSRYLFNSVFVSVANTFLYLFVATMAAYPLAKHDFPGRKIINNAITLALMFTASVTGLVQYLIMSTMGIIDSYWAMILPGLSSTMGVFLCIQFLSTLPDVILEAARVDGLDELRIFTRIVVPNIKPVLFTMLIFQFQAVWNSAPGNYIYTEEFKTLPLVMSQVTSAGISRSGVASAVAVIMMVPPIFVFVISQSNVMETMAHSGIKD